MFLRMNTCRSVDSKELRLHKDCATLGAFWGGV
jgi:hypothetical protein